MYNKIHRIMSDSANNGTSIGSSCLVFQHGSELFGNSVGFADKSRNIPMSTDTVCRLFSLSKPITATAAMIAMDQGLFGPETQLAEFFPEFSHMSLSSDSTEIKQRDNVPPITIEHLLNMTAGLPYPSDWCDSVRASGDVYMKMLNCRAKGETYTTEQFARDCASIPLYNIPDDYWFYGVEADIIGAVIERSSGMRYSEFLKKHIFEPLEMTDTDFYVPESKRDRLAALYSWSDNRLVQTECSHLGIEDFSDLPAFESGGAGIFSTINDYSKFANMLCTHECHNNIRLISEKAFQYMTSPKFNSHQLRSMWDRLNGYNYSCFMRIMTDVEKSRIHSANGEFGWDGWTGTYFCVHPESGITVLYFTQICGASTTDQAAEIVNTVFKELL